MIGSYYYLLGRSTFPNQTTLNVDYFMDSASGNSWKILTHESYKYR